MHDEKDGGGEECEVSVRMGYRVCAGRGGTYLDEGVEMGSVEGQIGPK
jgi:hypothetical protein